MKLAKSGSRGVFWRANERGTQEQRLGKGRRERAIGGFAGLAPRAICIASR